MKIVKVYCDRCGEEMEDEYFSEGDGVAYCYHKNNNVVDGKYVDLCEDCERELKEWYGGKNGTD